MRSRWFAVAVALVLGLGAQHAVAAGGEDDTTPPQTRAVFTPAAPGDGGIYPPGPVSLTLYADDGEDGSGVALTQYRIDDGPWQRYGEEVIFDGTPASFLRWRQAPAGAFALQPDGTIQSVGGLGMLWYPQKEYGDVALKLQFRDAAPDGFSNSGVLVRFPDPDDAVARLPEDQYPCQSGLGQVWTAWVAIACGHEVQIYDGPSGEVQKTGSIYNFQPLTVDQAKPVPKGLWSDYEIRTEGGGSYTLTVIRNGEVINTFANTPGRAASREGDPPTDLRQFASGHVGLQNHLVNDVIQFRDIRVQHLTPEGGTFQVTGVGEHVVGFRSRDVAGNLEPVKTVRFRIAP